MGVYTGSYITSEKPYAYLYRCSKCGKLIAQHASVKGYSEKFNGRAGITKKSLEEAMQRKEAATRSANERAQAEYDRLAQKIKSKDFKGTQLTGACPECGYKEPWQRLVKPSYIIPLTCFSLMFLLIGISGLVQKAGTFGYVLLGVSLAAFAFLLYGAHRRKKCVAEAKTMPETSLPHLYLTEAEFNEACKALNWSAGEKICK